MRAALASALLACLMSTQTAAPPNAKKVRGRPRHHQRERRHDQPAAARRRSHRRLRQPHRGRRLDRRNQKIAGPRTRVMDAGGRSCCPALTTRTYTFFRAAFSFRALTCATPPRPGNSPSASAASTKKLPRGRWVTGGDWDHERWAGPAPLPTKELIDAFTPETPGLRQPPRRPHVPGEFGGAKARGCEVATQRCAGRPYRPRRADRRPDGRVEGRGEDFVGNFLPARASRRGSTLGVPRRSCGLARRHHRAGHVRMPRCVRLSAVLAAAN